MLMGTRELLGSHCTEDVIAFFAKKFAVSTANVEKLFEEIEEWWFVPRSLDAVKVSNERVLHACTLYQDTQQLVDEYLDAYRFAQSEKNSALEHWVSEGAHTCAAA
jgi:hypothetical protein